MEVNVRETAVWEVRYKGRPQPALVWYDINAKPIVNSEKYQVSVTKGLTILKIMNVKYEDSGLYTLNATNSQNSTEKKFRLFVKGQY